MVEPEGSIRVVKVDGFVDQLSIDPADEAGEVGVPGKCLLLIPEGLLLEVSILTEIATPLLVGVEGPTLWPCDATDPEVIEVGSARRMDKARAWCLGSGLASEWDIITYLRARSTQSGRTPAPQLKFWKQTGQACLSDPACLSGGLHTKEPDDRLECAGKVPAVMSLLGTGPSSE